MRISDWSSDVCSSDLADYLVQGFVDTDRKRLNSYMEQKKVYHFKDLGKLKESKDIEELVVVNENTGMRDKQDRKRVGSGKSGSVRVDLGGRSVMKQKEVGVQRQSKDDRNMRNT